MLRRSLSFLLIIALMLSIQNTQMDYIYAENEAIYVSMGSPAIPLTKGESVSIDKITVEFSYKVSYKGTDINFVVDESNKEGIKVENGKITADKTGVYKLVVEKGNFKRNVYAVVRERESDEFIIFSDDFNNELSKDYRLIEGSSQNVYINNGFLFIKGNALRVTRLLLPEFLDEFGNYEIEVVSTLMEPMDKARWNSVMFRNQEGNRAYLQMAIRSSATAANGVEIAENTGNWIIHKKGAYKEDIDALKLYTYKINADNDNIKCYINDEEILSAKLEGHLKGGVGFQADRSIMKIDSVKVKYIKGVPSKDINVFTEIAQPQTGIIGGMGFSEIVESEEELNKVCSAEVKPSNVIFYVNKDLKVTDKTLNNPYMDLGDAINSLMGIIMPTLYVKDAETADLIAQYINKNKLEDLFVMSDTPELVLSIRKTAKMARGVIDFSEKYADKDTVTENELLDIRGTVNANYASIAVIPSNIATVENVKYLYDRLIAVWVNEASSLTSNTKAFNLLITGAHGIVSDNTELLYDVTKLLSGNKLLRTPLNIGHRGIPSLAPENTIEGALLAYQNGADVIEIDVYLTKDKIPVIMHDGNTARTCNGVNLDIQSSTLAQLKELNANEGRAGFDTVRIPTLEEFYKAIKDLDVQVFVELKSEQKDLVAIVKEVTEKCSMTNRISTIMFSANNIKKVKELYPVMSAGYLCSSQASGATSSMQTKNVLKLIQPYGSTYNPSYVYHSPDFFNNANMRGITTWPWTMNDSDVITYFLAGANGLTTNTSQVLAPMTKSLSSKSYEYKVKPGGALNIESIRTTYERKNFDASKDVKVIVLEGKDNVTIENGVLKVGKEEGTIVYALEYTQVVNELDSYTVYSKPITVNVEAPSSPIKIIALISSILVLLIGIFTVLFIYRRKSQKV